MKKFGNITVLVFLVCVFAGLCIYTVYATITANLNFSNNIYFTTNGEVIYFKAEITILEKGYDPDDPDKKGQHTRTLDYSGESTSTIPQDNSNYEIEIPAINFSSSMNEITYKIKITNYSEYKIKTVQVLKSAGVLGVPTGPLLIKNTTTSNVDEKTLNEKSFSGDAEILDSFEYTSTISCLRFTKSFQFNHSITINLTKVF